MVIVAASLAADTTVIGDEPLPEFRRIFAPADRASDWPFRLERYLPIPAAQFEQAVRQAQDSAAPPAEAAVTESRITAQFDGRDRLIGQAVITLKPVEPGPRLIPLASSSVPLMQAVWRETNTPAVLGNTLDGATAVWVERPGTLVCQWSSLGVRDAVGGVLFDLNPPAATASSFTLTLPTNYELQDAAAVRLPRPTPATQDSTYEIRPLTQRRKLRIIAARSASSAAPRYALRQDSAYEYSERGIDMTMQLRIDAVDEPLTKLELEYDPGLSIVDARLADRRLLRTDAESTATPRRTAIEFDPPLFGAGRTVLIRGLAAAQVGKRQLLPTVRCPQLDWRQGTISLAVAEPLVVDRFDPSSCVAGVPARLAGERGGEAFEFTCFDPKASLRVLVTRQREVVEATGVTTVLFGEDETKAEQRVELRAVTGEKFMLQAAVPTRWIVDSVTASTPTALANWTLSDVREKHRWLTIRLTQALKPDRPLRLTIAARTKRPGTGASLTADDLRIIEFRDVRVDAPIAAVRSADSWRLQLEREREEAAPTVEKLDPLRRELLGEFVPEFLLDLREAADPWMLSLSRRAARLNTSIAATADFRGEQLTESYRIRVDDEDGSPLERLEVRFAPTRKEAIAWSWGDDRSGGLQARRLTTTGRINDGVETWEILFPTPQSGPIELHALRRTAFHESNTPAFAAVTNSASSAATIEVESDAATPITIDRAGLRPLPLNSMPTDVSHRVRGRYAYEPGQSVVAALSSTLTVRRLPPEARSAPAVVWNARQQTAYEADGRTTQRIRLWVQSFGGESFRWTFPATAEEISVRVNNEPVEVHEGAALVPLPAHSEFATVTAEFTEHVHAAGPLRLAAVDKLNVDLPILQLERDLQLPPHFEVLNSPSGREQADLFVAGLRRLANPWLRLGSDQPSASATAKSATAPSSLWEQGELSFSPGVPTTDAGIWLLRSETAAAFQFAVAAIACVFALRNFVRRRTRYWFAVGMTSAAATILPAQFAVFAVWSLYGILLAAVLDFTLPRLLPRRALRGDGRIGTVSTNSGTASRPAVVTLWPFALLAAAAMTPVAAAQTPEAGAVAAEVFIPVGSDGKPSGERYQVPERFWRALERRIAGQDPASLGSSVFTDADYTVIVAHDARRNEHVISEFRAVWNVHVVAAPAEAAVPFSLFDPTSTAVLIDGNPAEPVRDATGLRLRLAFEKVGPHRVEVIVRTATAEPALGSGSTLVVPRVNDGRIRIAAPPELKELRVLEAAETPTVTADRRTISARLLPSGSLTLTWQEATPADAVEFEQYEWWRVRPGSVTVDVKFRVVSPTAAGRDIVLVADPRLQWLPRRNDDAEAVEVATSPLVVEQATVAQRLKLTLPDNLRSDSVIEAGFLVNGAAGIGRLRLPEIRVERRPARRRLFAVSVDPSLEAMFAGNAGVTPFAVPEFERLWGATTGLPQAVFEVTAPRNDWSLAIRPKPTKITAAETETLVVGRRRVDITYEAEITPTGDAVTRLELAAPIDFEVASASVVDVAGDGEEHRLRYSRDDLGAMIVFLRNPLLAPHKLVVRGRWSPAVTSDVTFPFLSLRNANDGSRRLEIVRLPEANVDLTATKNLVSEPPGPAGTAIGGRGRLVGIWRVTGANPAAKLKITPNVPKIAVEAVSTLRRDLQAWEYDFVAQLDVSNGTVDEIRLDFPASVALPLTVIPAMPYEVAAAREPGRRQLILHPRDSVKGKFQFALRGDLTALDREHPMPYVRLRGATTSDYFFQLPARTGLNRVAWDVVQLALTPLPNGFSKPTTDDVVTYRALGPNPAATLREVRRGTGRPMVRLAEHRLHTAAMGEDGVSTWLVEPSGATEFRLLVPAGTELLAVRSGGVDAVPIALGPNMYRIPAAGDQMPHFVEIAYRRDKKMVGDGLAAEMRGDIVAPELEGLPVDRTLWTIVDAAAARPWSVADSADAAALQTQRIQTFVAVENELRTEQGVSETQAWIEPLERRRRRASGGEVSVDPAVPIGLDEAWDEANASGAPIYVAAVGARPTIVRLMDDSAGTAWQRLFAPAACLFVAALFWAAGRCDGLWRWSPLLGALLGIAWIVWLQPAFVGWIIVAAMLGTRLHGSLRKARERRPTAIGGLRLAR
jgi:hypothetical protein